MKPEERFKILGARCLVQEIRQDAETSSGIVIPGREKEQTNKGIVLTVGDGAILEDGTKVKVTTREAKKYRKDMKDTKVTN